jgi:hypothetical protein
MPQQEATLVNAKLKSLIQEACSALAQLDADRLEELALSCRALNQSQVFARRTEADVRAACTELSVLKNVLKATKANLEVLERIARLRERPFANDPQGIPSLAMRRENPYGDN